MARWKAWLLCGPVAVLAAIGAYRVNRWFDPLSNRSWWGIVEGALLIVDFAFAVVILKVVFEAVTFYEHGGIHALRRLPNWRRDDP